MSKKDSITNWYDKIEQSDKELTRKPELDKNFKQHYILPNSHVGLIGQTGTGKSNAIIEFIKRSSGRFYSIILYSGSSTDEPLFNFLKKHIPEIEEYDDISNLPSLKDYDNDEKHLQKLIIFDDFTDLSKKQMIKINEYFKAGRKFGFSCWACGQNYTSIPKNITRNCQYFILFKQNDNCTLNNIIRNHNTENIPKDIYFNAYKKATDEPRNFLLIDTTTGSGIKKLRHNFLNFIL